MDRQKTLCHETTHFLSCAEQKLFDANGNELPMYFLAAAFIRILTLKLAQ